MLPHDPVCADGGALPAAAAALQRHRVALDALRADTERELVEHARCRRDVEALIERLIAGLDELDGDADLEGLPGPGGSIIDPDLDVDVADEPHDEADEGNAEPSLGWTEAEARRPMRASFAMAAELEVEHDGREPDDEGDALHAGESDGLEHGELDDSEFDLSTQAETYGRGWQDNAVKATTDENRSDGLFSGVAVGALAKWKTGRFAGARAIPGEGRARP